MSEFLGESGRNRYGIGEELRKKRTTQTMHYICRIVDAHTFECGAASSVRDKSVLRQTQDKHGMPRGGVAQEGEEAVQDERPRAGVDHAEKYHLRAQMVSALKLGSTDAHSSVVLPPSRKCTNGESLAPTRATVRSPARKLSLRMPSSACVLAHDACTQVWL
eukprot:6203264-Pleurochrysis_carterae.AAC.2